ncbi:MAG: heme ABC transporter permease [Pseudomonadota bacterium]|nr:heme ABC transporter permease [Pseudomonadota bacterium]
MFNFFHKMASPRYFYQIAASIIPWFMLPAIVLMIFGTINGLFVAPPDYQQGDAYRIIYVHVPSAYISMLAYSLMAITSLIALIWRIKLAHAITVSAAPLGAWFTFLALITGSIWGKPMWGTWWEWGDPRLTSELLMLFLYLGYMALRSSIIDENKADQLSSILILVGAINIPIIHFSVEWWNSLHQTSTLLKIDGPAIATSMLIPLLSMIIGLSLYFGALLLIRTRAEVLLRNRRSKWVNELFNGKQ